MLRRNLLKAFLAAPAVVSMIGLTKIAETAVEQTTRVKFAEHVYRSGYDPDLVKYLAAGGDIKDDPIDPKHGVFYKERMFEYFESEIDQGQTFEQLTYRSRWTTSVLRSYKGYHPRTPVILVDNIRTPKGWPYPKYLYSADVALVPIRHSDRRHVIKNRFESI